MIKDVVNELKSEVIDYATLLHIQWGNFIKVLGYDKNYHTEALELANQVKIQLYLLSVDDSIFSPSLTNAECLYFIGKINTKMHESYDILKSKYNCYVFIKENPLPDFANIAKKIFEKYAEDTVFN